MSDTDDTPIQKLRERADQATELEKASAAKDREIAFLKAGIDPDDTRMRYFVNGYDGELTKDAITAEAKAAGFIVEQEAKPQPSTEEGQEPEPTGRTQPTAEQQALEDINDSVRQDTEPPGPPPEEDLMDTGFKEFHKDISNGRRREDAASHVIGRLIAKGVEGEPASR